MRSWRSARADCAVGVHGDTSEPRTRKRSAWLPEIGFGQVGCEPAEYTVARSGEHICCSPHCERLPVSRSPSKTTEAWAPAGTARASVQSALARRSVELRRDFKSNYPCFPIRPGARARRAVRDRGPAFGLCDRRPVRHGAQAVGRAPSRSDGWSVGYIEPAACFRQPRSLRKSTWFVLERTMLHIAPEKCPETRPDPVGWRGPRYDALERTIRSNGADLFRCRLETWMSRPTRTSPRLRRKFLA